MVPSIGQNWRWYLAINEIKNFFAIVLFVRLDGDEFLATEIGQSLQQKLAINEEEMHYDPLPGMEEWPND